MSFERLLKPRSIAVFGGAQAQEVIRQSDRMGYTGEIWPVHPRKTEVLGRTVYRSVADLPGSPDAAYVGVNRHLTIDIVRDLAARSAGGAVCYATGFTEAGEEGSELEAQLLAASGDMPLVGPNCYGLLNYLDGAMLWPDQQGGRRVDKGVAIITMSSNVGFSLTMQRRGLPIAYLLSLGNKLKFDLHDAIQTFARQDRVTALGLYVETMPDPKVFQEAVNVARELGKPIAAVKTGRSDVGQKMVVSHTASLAGSDVLVSALFERLGVARVDSLEGLVEALKVLHVLGPLNGGRIGAMSTSGGDLTLLADGMGPGLTMPPLSDKVAQRLRATVHERVVAANPFDYQMFGWDDEDHMAEKFSAFLSEDFDVSLCLLDYPREDCCDQSSWGGAERGFVRAAQQTGTKGAVLATFSDTITESVAARLMKEGIALLAGVDTGLAGIQAAVDVGAAWSRPPGPPLLTVVGQRPGGPARVLNEAESKSLLARYGVAVPAARVVRSAGEAAAAAEELGYPVVVKALGVAHKTEIGGVRLDLGSELIVGVARDEQFGPYLLVGGGGILVEIMKDSASLLLPTSREHVLHALGQLKCAPLLNGFRGAPPADLNAAADVILAVASMVEKGPSSISELDINPLMLLAEGQGAVAADALISLNAESASDSVQVADAAAANHKRRTKGPCPMKSNGSKIEKIIVEKAIELGASLAGFASIDDLKASPSYAAYDSRPFYEEYKGVKWRAEHKSVLVWALAHPASDPVLDWWSMKVPGFTPGNGVMRLQSRKLRIWLGEELGINALSLPYQIEYGGAFLKDSAHLAGLGVIGRNNLLVTPQFGTRVRLRGIFMEAALEPTGPLDFDPCNGCDRPCHRACPRDAFRSGSFERSRCRKENDQRDADAEMLDGSIMGIEEPSEVTKPCRYCEFACPVAQGASR